MQRCNNLLCITLLPRKASSLVLTMYQRQVQLVPRHSGITRPLASEEGAMRGMQQTASMSRTSEKGRFPIKVLGKQRHIMKYYNGHLLRQGG